MTWKCPDSLRVWLRSMMSVGAGGAAGALMNLYHAGFDPAHIDWHRFTQTAIGGAVLAVVFHYAKPPNACGPAKQS
jgi:hypothetical protein